MKSISEHTLIIKQSHLDFGKIENLPEGVLVIAAGLTGFQQTGGHWEVVDDEYPTAVFEGEMVARPEDRICPHCGAPMRIHSHPITSVTHVSGGCMHQRIDVRRTRMYCPVCCETTMRELPFVSADHRITLHEEQWTEQLLQMGLTLKETAALAGLHPHTVKSIDMARLQALYTEDGKLKKPDEPALTLLVDEFKLANGPEYATMILDGDTGKALWLQKGKTKKVIYDFMEFVGEEFMLGVQAVASDMNASYGNAFREWYPHIDVVYDLFHIVKNYNEMVLDATRKKEQERLMREGRVEEARSISGAKFILLSHPETLEKKDAKAGQIRRKGSKLFCSDDKICTGDRVEKLEKILSENTALFTAYYIREDLVNAYRTAQSGQEMAAAMIDIICLCRETGSRHFERFANLLEKHLDGIITYPVHHISTGRIEGMNRKIKTIRREAYGLPDDDYFFLKVMDASRRKAA